MKARIILQRRQKGLSLIESVISSGLVLFILSSSFLVINSTVKTSVTTEKRVLLAEQLDKKNRSIHSHRPV